MIKFKIWFFKIFDIMKVRYNHVYSESEYDRYEKFILLKDFLGMETGTLLKFNTWGAALMFGGGWQAVTDNGYFSTSMPKLSRTFILLHRKYFKIVE